jgi:hypothetical protein
MSLIDTYRNNVLWKKSELAKLQNDKSNETKKIPALNRSLAQDFSKCKHSKA